MGKISSYPSDANVTTSDRLIGSDNENSNETKNFEVGDIITLASSIILPQVAGSYVPYTGATGDVFLGSNELYANAGYLPYIYATNIHPTIGINSIYIGDDGLFPIGGLIIDRATNFISLGDIYSQFNNTRINIEDNSSRITFVGGFYVANGEGTAGQILSSNGSGLTPSWITSPLTGFVPYTGATGNVDLGLNSLTATSIFANNFGPIASGDVFFGGAGGYGVAQNGVYALASDTTILGDSSSLGNGTKVYINDSSESVNIYSGNINVEIDGVGQSVGFFNTAIDFGSINKMYLYNGQGTAGESVLVSGGSGGPSWAYPQDIIEFPFLSAYSDSTQIANAVNVGQAMTFNQTIQSFNTSISFDGSGNLSRITFGDSGVYNIQFSAQLLRTTGGSSQTVDIWFRKGGVNIPYSNTSVNVQANAGFLVAAWNFFYEIDVTQPDPYIEIMWATTDVAVQIEQAAANAVHPATPSVILTVNKVSK